MSKIQLWDLNEGARKDIDKDNVQEKERDSKDLRNKPKEGISQIFP